MTELLVPPHSPESERAVIGALLVDNRVWDRIELDADDFFNADRREVFGIIGRMIAAGENADVVTVRHRLPEDGIEPADLIAMAKDCPSVVNAHWYAKDVRDCAVRRRLIDAGREITERAYRQQDVGSLVDKAQERVMAIAPAQGGEGPQVISAGFHDWMQRVEHGDWGMSTGFDDLDRLTHGLHRGEATFIAGRPGMGKSTIALNIASHVAQSGTVLMFSLEMTRTALLQRRVCAGLSLDHDDVRSGNLSADDWKNVKTLCREMESRGSLIVDDAGGLSVQAIQSRAREVKRKHGLDMVIVDHIHKMDERAENRTDAIRKISGVLTALGKQLDVSMVILAQLNREVEKRPNKRPNLGDLRSSGDLEQDADLVLLLYRHEYYTGEQPGVAEVEVAKQRDGRCGKLLLNFSGGYCRFGNLDHGAQRDYWQAIQPGKSNVVGFEYRQRKEGE